MFKDKAYWEEKFKEVLKQHQKPKEEYYICEFCKGKYVITVTRQCWWTYYCQDCNRDIQGELICIY